MKTEQKNWYSLKGFNGKDGRTVSRLIQEISSADSKSSAASTIQLLQTVCSKGKVCELALYAVRGLIEQLYAAVELKQVANLFILLARLKPLVWSSDLMQFPEEARIAFFDGIRLLEGFCGYFFKPEEISKLNAEGRQYFGFFYLFLCTHSNDLIPLYPQYPFDKAMHVRCPHCGDDVHSLHLKENAGLIAQRDSFLPTEERWDVFSVAMAFLIDIHEETLIQFLPFLYGTISCPVCGKESRVMDLLLSYYYEAEGGTPPSDALVDWLMEYGDSQQEQGGGRAWFFHASALNYLRDQPDIQLHRLGETYLKLSADYERLQDYHRQLACSQLAEEIAEQAGDTPLLAKAYRAIAAACQREIPDLEGNQEEIVREYEEKAAALLAQEGEEIPQA